MNNNGMFYTNVDDYETKEDMMNDFIALRMYDMAKDKEIDRLNNIINELEWKTIDEYFKNKEKYDWVLVKYYDKYNFECIPSVAEYRFDKWYLKDNEKSLQDFEVRYFFDMQQLDKLKELKEGNK